MVTFSDGSLSNFTFFHILVHLTLELVQGASYFTLFTTCIMINDCVLQFNELINKDVTVFLGIHSLDPMCWKHLQPIVL